MKTNTGWKITYTNQGDRPQFNAFKNGFGVAHQNLHALIALTEALDADAQSTTTTITKPCTCTTAEIEHTLIDAVIAGEYTLVEATICPSCKTVIWQSSKPIN